MPFLLSLALAAGGPSITPATSVPFATFGIRISDNRVSARLEVFLGSGNSGDLAQRILAQKLPTKITWDGKLVGLKTSRQLPGPPHRLVFEFEHRQQEKLAVGPHQLLVSELVCPPGTELNLALLTAEGTILAGVSPGAAATQTSRLSGGWGERTVHRYRECPAILVVDVDVKHKGKPVSSQVLDRAIQYGVPVMTALLILILSTLIQRWLSLRGTQQGVRQALEARMQRIEEKNEAAVRQELLEYIRLLREKPEYGGFSSKFTSPLDMIVTAGNIEDIGTYRKQLKAMKMGVKFSWIFFTRGGA